LEKIQCRGLHLICAVFRTMPVAALEIKASIPPIRIELDRLNHSCALRFNKLSTSNPIIQRLDDSWRAAGAGLVGYHKNNKVFSRSIGLGFRAEAYDGEIVGLSYAAGLASSFSEQKLNITHWQFFSDSLSSVESVFDTSP
ncbi:hypothetical protein BT96DRAFT_771374, partial [Gymnopus androsaceus JB14]